MYIYLFLYNKKMINFLPKLFFFAIIEFSTYKRVFVTIFKPFSVLIVISYNIHSKKNYSIRKSITIVTRLE